MKHSANVNHINQARYLFRAWGYIWLHRSIREPRYTIEPQYNGVRLVSLFSCFLAFLLLAFIHHAPFSTPYGLPFDDAVVFAQVTTTAHTIIVWHCPSAQQWKHCRSVAVAKDVDNSPNHRSGIHIEIIGKISNSTNLTLKPNNSSTIITRMYSSYLVDTSTTGTRGTTARKHESQWNTASPDQKKSGRKAN